MQQTIPTVTVAAVLPRRVPGAGCDQRLDLLVKLANEGTRVKKVMPIDVCAYSDRGRLSSR